MAQRNFAQERDSMRDSMRHVAAAYLKPAETVQCVFPAQTSSGIATVFAPGPGVFGVIGGLFGLNNRSRIFVVTDQRILVLDAGRILPGGALDKLAVMRAHGVVAELPRSTRLGPPSGRLIYVINVVNGEKLRVFSTWFKDIEKADSERPGG